MYKTDNYLPSLLEEGLSPSTASGSSPSTSSDENNSSEANENRVPSPKLGGVPSPKFGGRNFTAPPTENTPRTNRSVVRTNRAAGAASAPSGLQMASPSGESELALALISSTTTPSGENQASPPQAPARMQRPAFLVAEDDLAASALTLEPLFVEYEDSNFLSFARVQRVFASFENCVPWETGRRRPD